MADHYAKPALVPTMAHLPASPLLFPVITHDSRGAAGVTLTIRPVWGEVTSYAVYRFKLGEQPCVTDDARNLVGTVRRTGKETTFVDTTAVEGERYVLPGHRAGPAVERGAAEPAALRLITYAGDHGLSKVSWTRCRMCSGSCASSHTPTTSTSAPAGRWPPGSTRASRCPTCW